jgi:hypothetical protein
VDLADWRKGAEAKKTAETVLSKPEYQNCKNEINVEAARCVLLNLSRGGAIRLIFIRYDEGKRNVGAEDIVRELSEKRVPPKQ